MKNKKLTIAIVLTAVISALLWGAGYAVGSLQLLSENVINLIRLILLIFVLIIALTDLIAEKLYVKRMVSVSVKEMNERFNERREEAINDLYTAARKTARAARAVTVYIVCLTFVAAAYILTAGAALHSCAFGVIILLYIIHKLLIISEKPDFSAYSSPDDYPRIYELARKAQKAVGRDGEIHILFVPSCEMGIARMGKAYSLIIGTILLNIASEDELYQGLIHEFTHFTKNCSPSYKEDKLLRFFTHSDVKYPCLRYVKAKFTYEYYVYKVTSSVCIERLADMEIVSKGDPRAAGAFLIKLDFYGHFNRNVAAYMGESFYASEEMRNDTTERMLERFKQVLPEKSEMWLDIIENEIQPRSASHPIVRERLRALGVGVADCNVDLSEKREGEFYGECLKALRESDKKRYDEGIELYEQERKLYYLDHLESIKKWQDEGCELDGAKVRDVLDCMCGVLMYDEAVELCDRMIEHKTTEYEKAHAYFTKGTILVSRYDVSGIDYLYKAMDLNENYIDGGLDQIGWICCTLGLQEELEKYRERAVGYAQSEKDNSYDSENVVKGRNLCPYELSTEVFDENLEFILKRADGQIFRLFLVGIRTPDRLINAYIVDFEHSCNQETAESIMYDIFCYLDTRPDGCYYSLYWFEKNMGKSLAKRPETLIYAK